MAARIAAKCAKKGQETLNLSGMRLAELPVTQVFMEQLISLQELNLSRNQLFNGDILFEVRFFTARGECSSSNSFLQALANLKNLKRLNLTGNFLNGPLSSFSCELTDLEVLHLDGNRITSLPTECAAWPKLKTLTLADNFLTGVLV